MYDLIDTNEKALAVMQRFLRASSMNQKGFRTSSSKNGPPKKMGFIDIVLVKSVGSNALPVRTESPRKKWRREVVRPLYLEAVRQNPKYPRGDRRLKHAAVTNL